MGGGGVLVGRRGRAMAVVVGGWGQGGVGVAGVGGEFSETR